MIFDNHIKESPFLGIAGFGGGISWDAVQKYLDAVYVDDVFSTYLYEGNSPSTQTITNGVDLSGEGGLVWIKQREATSFEHILTDTERGAQKYLSSDNNLAEQTGTTDVTGFNSNGFNIGSSSRVNSSTLSSNEYASWTFRKAPGFFDVVTYTGDKVIGRTIAHNLGSVPGMIIIKGISGDSSALDWFVYNRSVGATGALRLNQGSATDTSSVFWNNTEPTSTHFTLGSSNGVNDTNTTYVAYLFAHDDQSFGTDEDEAIIKCGSYTGNLGTGQQINVGFEPQWLLIKRTDTTGDWHLFDNMRNGLIASGSSTTNMTVLYPNRSDQELDETDAIYVTSNGFEFRSGMNNGAVNGNNNNYIYMAIRRPHKPVTAGTDVFKAFTWAGDGVSENLPVPFAPDFMHVQGLTSGTTPHFIDKVRGKSKALVTSAAEFETNPVNGILEFYEGGNVKIGSDSTFNGNSIDYGGFALKRAPGFFDIVHYTGNSPSTQNISHNLGVIPELIIVKSRDNNFSWAVYASGLGADKYMVLDEDTDAYSSTTAWNNTTPTASVFTVGDSAYTNANNNKIIAYLFATLAGISKVGTYTGTGNNVDVDCGFSLGARFILIKRTDVTSTGDWYWWDSVRGINAGNDPYARFNLNTTEVTNTDYIDPLNSGFTVTSSAPDALNAVGGTYIFLAIA